MCVEVRMVAFDLTEEEAFKIECDRITFWRSVGIKTANMTNGGEGVAGLVFSEEHRRKLGLANKGKKRPPMSDDQKGKMSERMKGKKTRLGAVLSQETKDKIGAGNRGKIRKSKRNPLSSKTIEHLAEIGKTLVGEKNPFFGKKHSEETRKKLSAGKTGEKHPFFGKKFSEETKDKMRAAWVRRRQCHTQVSA